MSIDPYWNQRAREAADGNRIRELDVALRNCLALAIRERRKAEDPEPWDHIIRFCKDAGVEPRILRTGGDDE